MKDKYKNLTEEEKIKRIIWYERKYGPYFEKKGLKNWKNLFRKPTLYEWTILFMIIMALFISWAYQRDVALCKETVKNQKAFYANFTLNTTQTVDFDIPALNISNFKNITGGELNQSDNLEE